MRYDVEIESRDAVAALGIVNHSSVCRRALLPGGTWGTIEHENDRTSINSCNCLVYAARPCDDMVLESACLLVASSHSSNSNAR